MKKLGAITATLCLWAWLLPAQAALTPSQERQIGQLLDKVAASGCQFVRNGTVYTAPDAARHLRRKLDAARDRLGSVTDFIVHIASKSSSSSQPYQVRCPGQPQQAAQPWLAGLQRAP